ncbi:hypothetical protein [Streptomyces sp. CB00072]|uniref:hypothetical protein n=1 Tax=Streptomyces sp. CB00072 TaxID=1703928 RepID=UPI001A7E0E47|nr:hypothetical protein [Streptomyces sp. CB00072]
MVAADAEKFRWPGPALLLLALSVIFLVLSVRWGYRARPYLYSMAEVEQGLSSPLSAAERARYVQQQGVDLKLWRRRSRFAAYCYTLGLIALGTGIALVLAPQRSSDEALAGWRWAAFWVVLFAVVVEAFWTLLKWGDSTSRAWEQRRRIRRAQIRQATGRGGSNG